jgi:hypothetical protein
MFIVRSSSIHGRGLFATCAIAAQTRLGDYEGRRLQAAELLSGEWNDQLTYLFELSDGTGIDGGRNGNDFRHLNHSCAPNCEAVERRAVDGGLSLEIVVLHDIVAGEELCIDYALGVDETSPPETYPCACGAPGCRGTMVGPNG